MSKEVSIIHSSFDGRMIAAAMDEFAKDHFDASEYRSLKKLGMGFNPGVLAEMARHAYAMDAIQQPLTAAGVPTPVQFLQNWLPGFVKIIFAAREIDEIVGRSTVGSWEDEEIVQPVLENLGTAVPYGDLNNVPLTNWNLTFVTRTVIRFESGLRVGNLEEMRAARVRVNSGQTKRESCGLALEIQRNQVGFYGYNSGNNQTYGFLNDPGAAPYIQVATGVGGYKWSQKTFLEICLDLRTALQLLRTQSQGTIKPDKTPITLAIATNAVDYLSTTSDFGYSVYAWLKEFYPNVRVVDAPQLNAANAGDGVFIMFADSVNDTSTDDRRTWVQVVPAEFQVLGVQKLAKGYEEDYSNATAGCMLKRPYAQVRFYNIS